MGKGEHLSLMGTGVKTQDFWGKPGARGPHALMSQDVRWWW